MGVAAGEGPTPAGPVRRLVVFQSCRGWVGGRATRWSRRSTETKDLVVQGAMEWQPQVAVHLVVITARADAES